MTTIGGMSNTQLSPILGRTKTAVGNYGTTIDQNLQGHLFTQVNYPQDFDLHFQASVFILPFFVYFFFQFCVNVHFVLGDSIYERVIKPHLRNNFVARQNNAINFAEKNVLFRHEVEKLKYQPKMHQIKKSRPSRANYQKEVDNAKLFNGQKPQTRGIGDLPFSNPWKSILYNEFVFKL